MGAKTLIYEGRRSGRIVGDDGDFYLVLIPKAVIAHRRLRQRESLRARRAKAKFAEAEFKTTAGGSGT